MRIFWNAVYIIFIFLFAGSVGLAQNEENYDVEPGDEYDFEEETTDESKDFGLLLSFDFDWNQPVSLTYERFKKPIFGFNTNVLYQIDPNKPIFTGMGFSIGQFSQSSIEYYDFLEFDEFLFKKTTSFRMLNIDLKMRYFPSWTWLYFEPFIDLGIGPRYVFALTSIHNVDLDENQNTRFENGDWELAYSVGFGSLIKLGSINENIFGHFSFNYSSGNNSFFYLKKGGVATGDPIDQYDRKSIPVRFLKIDFGLILYI
jgi:hypothetical protein